ncbi:hypothetical protein ACR79S_05355 [Sphingobacterium spiritivorum]|uniref:hypothetical protein n=1 Tax=Sphingobacterium spiritivorum TaxID=258 RepID=UPI003DA6BC0F
MKNAILLMLTAMLIICPLYAQTGIGTKSPNPSSILHLDVSSLPANNKKGFLGPQVELLSATDVTTIPSPARGLIVYNLGTGGLSYEGYVFWNGSSWRTFEGGTTLNGTIGAINCSGAELFPNNYTSGIPYSGIMKVPYTDGNGGSYPSGTPIPSTGVAGLTATLQPGKTNVGSGELLYAVTGTPSNSSPTLVTFSLSATAGVSGCNVTVGRTLFDSEGSKVYKVKHRGRNIDTDGFPKPTLLAPEMNLQFRWAVISGVNRLQVRLMNQPSSNVNIFYIGHWSGSSHNSSDVSLTFTAANYNIYQNIDGVWNNNWGYYYQFATNEIRSGTNNPLNFVANLYGLCGFNNGWGAANEPYSLALELF